ncbi:hypothetical protein [Undibacterium sp. TJN19]|uniref:hypothetical protein n=1 Tax=Undibacterium sp. TJN19 TaxID=3413055 RepID=UPI003BF29808
MTLPNVDEEHIATLVYPDEYAKNINQIASVSTQKLVFVKRKVASLTPFELLQFSLSECSAIFYEIKWAVVSMIFGGLLALSILLVLAFGSFPAGMSVPIGAMGFCFVLGVVLLRGPKRHRLTFVVNGKKFRWQSKAGDFKYKLVSTQKIVAFAKEKGIFSNFDT